ERSGSTLGQAADLCVALGPVEEACPLGLAPSASATVLMAVCGALSLFVGPVGGFSAGVFWRFYPGGTPGGERAGGWGVWGVGGVGRVAACKATRACVPSSFGSLDLDAAQGQS